MMLFRFISLFFCLSLSVAHAEYAVSHKEIVYSERDTEGVIVWVTNTGDDLVKLKVRTRFWTQDTERKGADLAVYPYRLEIKPGEQKAIRLLLRNPDHVLAPLFYRLEFTEVDWYGEPKGKVVTSLPVYYVDPAEPIRAYAMRSKSPQGDRMIVIKNPGKTIAKLTRFRHAGKRWVSLNRVILPGQDHAFDVTGLQGPYQIDVQGLSRITIPGPSQQPWE